MKIIVKQSATSRLATVFIQDSSKTDGSGLTGLVFNTSNLKCYYYREADASSTVISLLTMTLGTWTTAGFVVVDATNLPGTYQLGLPNAVFASLGSVVIYLSGATNMAPVVLEFQVVAADLNDSVHLGLTCLPNTAVSTNGSLLTSGTGTDQLSLSSGKVLLQATQSGVTIPTVTTVTNQLSLATIASGVQTQLIGDTSLASYVASGVWTDALGTDFTATSSIGKSLYTTGKVPGSAGGLFISGSNTATTVNFTGNLSGSVGSVTGAVGSVTGAVGSVTAGVTVTTNNDKTGYSLTQTFPTNFSSLSVDASGRVDLGKILGTASAGAVGYVGIDWAQIANKTTANALTGTTVSATQVVASVTGAVGSVTGAVGSISGITFPTNFGIFSIDANGRVDISKNLGVAVTLDANNVLNVSAKYLAGTALTGRDIGSSVLLSPGTGTGQLDITSGVTKANAVQLLGGVIPAPNVTGVPLIDLKYTLGTLSPATAGYTAIDWGQVANKTTTNALTGTTLSSSQVVASVTGSVGSVTGAVGSISGITFPTNFGIFAIDGSGRVDIGETLGSPVTLDANSTLNVSTLYLAGTTQTPRDIGASVLVSPGTATGQLSLTSGILDVNVEQLQGIASQGAGGYAAIDWAQIHSPTTVQNLSNTTIATTQTVAPVTLVAGSITDASFTTPSDGTGQATSVLSMLRYLYDRFFGKTVVDSSAHTVQTFQADGATVRTTQTTITTPTQKEIDRAT